MRKDFEQLFVHIAAPQPKDGLLGRIMARIGREQRVSVLKRRVAVVATIMLASGAASVASVIVLRTEVESSGFTKFLSLLFSDAAVVLSSWQSFSYSLLESLPAASMAVFLATALVFAGSVSFLSRDVRTLMRSRSRFA